MPSLFYSGPSLAVLHDEYARQGRIDPDAPLVSSSEIVVGAAPRAVWEAITDLRGWAAWAPGIEVLDPADPAPGAAFRWRLRRARIRSTFAVVEPERELTWTGTVLGFKAVDRHLLEPLDGGRTRVAIQESLAGPLLPLFYSTARLRAGHEEWLGALKTFVENG
jgi:hypothetical protein